MGRIFILILLILIANVGQASGRDSLCTAVFPVKQEWFELDTLSSGRISESPFTIYPNPANNYFYIAFNLEAIGAIQIEISDLRARKIENVQIEYPQNANSPIRINLDKTNISNGFYFVNMKINNQNFNKTIIIKKESTK